MAKETYGVSDLAKLMDVEPSTVRVKLRNSNIKKSGGSYEWGSKSELASVAKKLEAASPAPKSKKKAKAKPKKKAKKTAKRKQQADDAGEGAAA